MTFKQRIWGTAEVRGNDLQENDLRSLAFTDKEVSLLTWPSALPGRVLEFGAQASLGWDKPKRCGIQTQA